MAVYLELLVFVEILDLFVVMKYTVTCFIILLLLVWEMLLIDI